LNSEVNRRRDRLPPGPVRMVDILSAFQIVSTQSGEAQVRYVQSRDAIEEKVIPEAPFLKMYDTLLYQITLRTVHELFEADTIDALDSVAFNGWVRSLDRATGKEVTACIMSLHVRKAEFNGINLAQVEPKVCFRGLKGVG